MSGTIRQTFTYESKTSSAVHTCNVFDDGHIVCGCRGFSTPNKCWHARDAATKLGRALETSTWGARLGDLLGVEEKSGIQPIIAPISASTGFKSRQPPPLSSPTPSLFPRPLGWVDPMLASALKEDMTLADYQKPGWVLEEKFDGHRILVLVTADGQVWCWKRSGNCYDPPTHVLKQLSLLAPGTYDGEIYRPGGTGTDVTKKIYQKQLKVALFDMLKVGDSPCMDLPTTNRRELLEVATGKINCQDDTVHVSPQFPVTQEGLQQIWNRGGEGAIIKLTTVRYRPGKRIHEWVKFIKGGTVIVTITGFKAGLLGPHSIILGVDPRGVETRCKTLNDEWRAKFAEEAKIEPHPAIGRKLVMSYREITRDGRYKHGMADHMLEDE